MVTPDPEDRVDGVGSATGPGADEADLGEALMEIARLLRLEQESTKRAETLNAINEVIRAAHTPEELLARLVDEVSVIAGADKSLVVETRDGGVVLTHVRNLGADLVGKLMPREFFTGYALAADSRRPVLVGDTFGDPRMNQEFVVPNGLRSTQILPLIVDGEVAAVVALSSGVPRDFTREDEVFAQRLAAAMSVALSNARLYEAEQLSRKRTEALRELTELATSSLDLRVSAERALAYVHENMGVDVITFWMLDEAQGRLFPVSGVGFPQEFYDGFADGLALDMPFEIATAVVERRAVVRSTDRIHEIPQPVRDSYARYGVDLASLLVLPLRGHAEVIGAVTLAWSSPHDLDSDEVRFFSSAVDELAMAAENARLYSDLLDSQQRVSSILSSISDGFYVLDRDWKFTYANAEAGRMIGAPAAELIGRTIGEALGDPGIQATQQQAFGPAMHEGRVVEIERHFPQTGIFADIRAYPSGEGVAVYGRDITQRKAAEEALKDVRERAEAMATMLDDSSQPFCVGHPDGSLSVVNRAYERLTGYSASELRQVSWATTLTPLEHADHEASMLAELERTGAPVRYEKEYLRKDGVRVPVELLVHLAVDEDGAPASYYAFVDDLTERKQRERLDRHLSEIRSAIGGTLDFAEVIGTSLTTGAAALGADAADAFVRDSNGWSVVASFGEPADGPASDLGVVLARVLAAEGGPLTMDDAERDPRLRHGFARRHGFRSLVAAPLGLEGAEVGFLAFYSRARRDAFTPAQQDFALRLARVTALAAQNSILYQRERTIAETLQEALLTAPESIGGVETAFVYRAASSTADVGGDFCEVFALNERLCAIVVGDVSGKGIEAARLTSLIHDGIRAYALETSDACEILSRVNRLVHLLSPPEQYATVFLATLDTSSGLLRYCTAGHPAPAIVSESGVEYLLGSRAPLLGAFEQADFDCLQAMLAPGDRLVAYTDGVTEARHGKQLLGEERLLKLLGKMRHTPVDQIPQRLLDDVLRYSGGQLRDDTVILSLALAETPEDGAVGE